MSTSSVTILKGIAGRRGRHAWGGSTGYQLSNYISVGVRYGPFFGLLARAWRSKRHHSQAFLTQKGQRTLASRKLHAVELDLLTKQDVGRLA